MLLERLLSQKTERGRLLLRPAVYTADARAELLRDVMALANAPIIGARYIIFGVDEGEDGDVQTLGIPAERVTQIQQVQQLLRQFIEPDIIAEVIFGDIGGKFVAALELNSCIDQPYLIKTDVSRDLRRGDCWVAEGGIVRPAQRLDFDRMYSSKTSASENSGLIKIGINGDPSVSSMTLALPDISHPPSEAKAHMLKQEIRARKDALKSSSVEDTGLIRLMRARLYGDETPLESQGLDTLVQGYNTVRESYHDADQHFYFETNALKLNFCIQNKSISDLEDAVLTLSFPRAKEFRIAPRIFSGPDNELSEEESALMGYPSVKEYRQAVQVKAMVGNIGPDEVIDAFEKELRIACTPNLAGKRMAIKYELQASNLPQAQRGTLKLGFTN